MSTMVILGIIFNLNVSPTIIKPDHGNNNRSKSLQTGGVVVSKAQSFLHLIGRVGVVVRQLGSWNFLIALNHSIVKVLVVVTHLESLATVF